MAVATVVPYISIGELSQVLAVPVWRIRRLFELGVLPDPPRIGGRRLIHKSIIPDIVEALTERGWFEPLPDEVLE